MRYCDITLLSTLVFLTACGDNSNAPCVPASIQVWPMDVVTVPDATSQLSAAASDVSGTICAAVSVDWSSSNTAVATVSEGQVTGVDAGTAAITATAGGASADAIITVVPLTGTWTFLSYVVAGVDFLDVVESFDITFDSSGGLSSSVTGDWDNVYCDGASSCTVSGTYALTRSTITFDHGTPEQTTINYGIDSDTMSWSGDLDGMTMSAILIRT